jgi:gliding motility-associated-like protein
LKQRLLLSLLLCISVFSYGANHYWVGKSGNWNDAANWSLTPDGIGGAGIPGSTDRVFIYQEIATDRTVDTIYISGNVACSALDLNIAPHIDLNGQIVYKPFALKGTGSLTIYGDLTIGQKFPDFFTGTWHFNDLIGKFRDNSMAAITANGHVFSGRIVIDSPQSNQYNNSYVVTNSLYVNNTIEIGEKSSLYLSENAEVASLGANKTAAPSVIFAPNATFVTANRNQSSQRLDGNNQTVLSHTVTTSVVPNPCNGDCVATATAIVTGGIGPFGFQWSTVPVQTTQTATGLCAGTYLVVVTDSSDMSQVPAFAVVQDPPPLVIFFSNTPPTCNGLCDGSSNSSVAGGTPGYVYLWSPGNQTTPNITNQCAGTYTLMVTDLNGCTRTQNSVITQPSALNPQGSSTNVTCFGLCDGTAQVNPTGATPGYTFLWTPTNATTNQITALCPGSHTCTVTDNNGCTATYSTTITEPQPLSATNVVTNASCFGICDGAITTTPAGGTAPYTYLWMPGNFTTPNINGLCAGSYTLTITDANNCTTTRTVVVSEPAPLAVNPTGTNITCNGACDGTATANASGGTPPYTYVWSPSGGNGPIASNLCPQTYTVVVTDNNGCTASGQVVITEPAVLLANVTDTDVSCFGACDGTGTSTPTGGTPGYTYSWAASGGTGSTTTPLCPGNYTVTVTDLNGCTATGTAVITQPTQLNNGVTQTDVLCNGQCNGIANATPSGGVGPYTYLWMPGAITTPSVGGLCAGSYTLTVTDANGCTQNSTVTITQPNVLTVTLNSTNLQCNSVCNATISTNVAGGTAAYTYLWNPGNQTTPSISNQCAGSYTCTVTDANGCTAQATVTITQPTALSITQSVTDVSCNALCNGAASVVVGGGTPAYTYFWAPGGQTTPGITNQCAGTYTCTVTDALGCTGTATITITEPQAINNSVTSVNASCSGVCNGTASSNPSGGTAPYTFLWMPGSLTTQNISGLCAGSYTLTVTDANGCTQQDIINITQPQPLSANVSATSSSCGLCTGSASVSVAGGTSPYAYFWSPAGGTNPTATNLCLGTYTCTITDAQGCTTSTSVTITQVVNITITSSGSTPSCYGACDALASANASGGANPYSYLWQPGNFTTQNITGLCAGTWTVTATDANGCFSSSTITFNNPPQLIVTGTSTNVSCNSLCDGTASAGAIGGTGSYTYLWLPGGQTTATITNQCAGSYTCTINDSLSCDTTIIVTITEPTLITANGSVTDANCTLCDGTISTAASGGSGPLTYSWNPSAATTPGIANLCPGIYTVTITDSTGCSTNTQFAVSNINGPTLSSSSTNATCDSTCDGTASTVVTGGSGPFVYDWLPGSPTGDGTPSVSGLCADTVFVQVTDIVGCITFDQIIITDPPALQVVGFPTSCSCNGICDGSATITVSGGTAGYTFLWMPGSQTTQNISGQCAGSYTVTVTDANGCTETITVTIVEPAPMLLNITSTNIVCNGQCNGTATSNITGGTAPFSYNWSSGPIVSSIVNLCPGSYTLNVSDISGCTNVDSVTITEPPALQQSVSFTDALCNGSCDGTAAATVSGGVPGYLYLWSPGGQTTPSVNGLCAGAYSITSTDTNGCQIVNSVTILQPTAMVLSMGAAPVSCFGSCDGFASVNASGGSPGYTYIWSPAGGTANTATGLCSGGYTVTVTDNNGCSQTNTATITTPSLLQSNTSFTSPSCGTNCDGTATATPIGGTGPYQYLWAPGGQTTSTITGLCSGSYTVTVRDANGCTDVQIVTVTPAASFSLTVANAPANCGVCNGTLNVTPSGGASPYTYSWTGGLPPQANQVNVCAGLYTVTVTDALGCQDTFVVAMNNSGGFTGETVITTGTSCPNSCDGTANVTPIGGTLPATYLWIPGGQTTNVLAGMCGGNYNLQMTDSNQCIRFAPVTITSPPPILANVFVSNASCNGVNDGTATANASGGTGPYTYLWAPGGQTTASIIGQSIGTYTVTVTDAAGCTQSDTITIGAWNTLTASALASGPTCNAICDGWATVNISSGTAPFTYQWNDPLGQNVATATGLCIGTYQVTISDAAGCSASSTVTIAQPTAIATNPVVTPTTCGQCNGNVTINASGGVGPYTYLWSNGSNSSSPSGLCSGVYSVLITDATGCTNTFSVAVPSSGGVTSSGLVMTNVTCFGANDGTAVVNPVGGIPPYTYLWVPGAQTTSTVNGLAAGTYYVQIMDSAGCVFTDSAVISGPTQITANQAIVNTDCGFCMGQITLNPAGGTGPYTFLWAPGGQTTPTITGLCAGLYTVTITDAAGCSQNVVIPVSNANSTIVMNTTSSNVICFGDCNGQGYVTVTGGTGPFAYNWSTGSTTDTANALCPGTYFVQVTDASGCVSTGAVNISQPSQLATSFPFTTAEMCAGACDGSIMALASGGTLPYTYTWSPIAQSTQTAINLCSGNYTCTITDANGCTTTTSDSIISPNVLVLGAPVVVDALCNNSPDGSIDITVSGGATPYTFAWTGPAPFTAATEDVSGVISGSYTVLITDANGCSTLDTIVVGAQTTIIADAGNDTSACVAGQVLLDGSLSANALTFTWTELVSGNTVGTTVTTTVVPTTGVNTYILTVSNNGCTDTDTILVTSLPQPLADAGPDQAILQGTSTTIGGSPAGPSGATFAWGPSTGLGDPTTGNPIAGPTTSTTYILVVTDSSGCTASDTMVLDIVPSIWFPDGFTPNGDGVNDVWEIDNIFLFPECEIEVYDRWGIQMFRSVGYNTPFDGQYNGKDLPVGTYYYIIKLNDPMFPEAFTGPLTIMR